MLLEARELRKAFGGNRAVDGVSLMLAPGELVALVGPNGAGKSTLLNLLTGQYLPDTGSVHLAGDDVTRRAPSHPGRRSVIRSFQDGGIFPGLSTFENVMVPAVTRGFSHKEAVERVSQMLECLGLTDVAQERADRLSGGQRKLIDVGRALAVDARIVLLDEPTAGVNPALVSQMGALIRERGEKGVTFLIVSHDLRWAFQFCLRVVVMSAGRVIAEGTPDAVLNDRRVADAYIG